MQQNILKFNQLQDIFFSKYARKRRSLSIDFFYSVFTKTNFQPQTDTMQKYKYFQISPSRQKIVYKLILIPQKPEFRMAKKSDRIDIQQTIQKHKTPMQTIICMENCCSQAHPKNNNPANYRAISAINIDTQVFESYMYSPFYNYFKEFL